MNKLKTILLLSFALMILGCASNNNNTAASSIPPLKVPANLDYLKLKMDNHYPIPKVVDEANKGTNLDKDDLVKPPQ